MDRNYYSNVFVGAKFTLRKGIKLLYESEDEELGDKLRRDTSLICMDLLHNVFPKIDKLFTTDEKVSLLGNVESCRECINIYREKEHRDPMMIDLILYHGEERKNRSRKNTCALNEPWEMPMFSAFEIYFMKKKEVQKHKDINLRILKQVSINKLFGM